MSILISIPTHFCQVYKLVPVHNIEHNVTITMLLLPAISKLQHKMIKTDFYTDDMINGMKWIDSLLSDDTKRIFMHTIF